MPDFLSTKEVAQLLNINEKMVYTLISEKGLPATKITGKWLFPKELVLQWVENHTLNYPAARYPLDDHTGLVIISGSLNPLLGRTLSYFNQKQREWLGSFAELSDLASLQALRRNLCHIAVSRYLQINETETYSMAKMELGFTPAIVNFCRREQGLLLAPGNPKKITKIEDLANNKIRIANRPLGTSTRTLLDNSLRKAGIDPQHIVGYDMEVSRHMDAGLAVSMDKVDVTIGIRAVATMLGLDFLPLSWERYDFLIREEYFFTEGIGLFLALFQDPAYLKLVSKFDGYDMSQSGKIVTAPISTEKNNHHTGWSETPNTSITACLPSSRI